MSQPRRRPADGHESAASIATRIALRHGDRVLRYCAHPSPPRTRPPAPLQVAPVPLAPTEYSRYLAIHAHANQTAAAAVATRAIEAQTDMARLNVTRASGIQSSMLTTNSQISSDVRHDALSRTFKLSRGHASHRVCIDTALQYVSDDPLVSSAALDTAAALGATCALAEARLIHEKGRQRESPECHQTLAASIPHSREVRAADSRGGRVAA